MAQTKNDAAALRRLGRARAASKDGQQHGPGQQERALIPSLCLARSVHGMAKRSGPSLALARQSSRALKALQQRLCFAKCFGDEDLGTDRDDPDQRRWIATMRVAVKSGPCRSQQEAKEQVAEQILRFPKEMDDLNRKKSLKASKKEAKKAASKKAAWKKARPSRPNDLSMPSHAKVLGA